MAANGFRSTMAYGQLVERVREWNLQFRLKEKYHTWALRPPLPKISPQFHIMSSHALISYVLQNIAWAVSDLSLEQKAHHLHQMKSSYSKMSIGTSISSETFNFSMILLVKSVAYFLSNHVKVVLVDMALECDIYRQTLLGILGIEIEQNTYRILLRMFRSRRAIAKERQSVEIDQPDDNAQETRTKTIQSIARRNGKHQTAFFNRIADLGQERARLQEIKFLLKSNLYVKPAVQRPQQKYSIQQLKHRQQPQRLNSLLNIRRSRQSPQKFIIQTNQLSHAFSSNSSLKLTDIKNHSIHCSHTRKISRPMLPKENKKLEIRREDARPEDRKGSKQIKNWTKIVTEMKEELYHHNKDLRLSEEMNFDHFEKRFDSGPKRNQPKKIAPQPKVQTLEDTFNFSKLNLKNSPNIIIYEGGASQPNQEQPNDPPQEQYQIKVNYSRVNQPKKRENTVHSILPQTHKA